MEGASFVTSYNRQEARRLAKDGALTESNARLVAEREGIKVVLTGAITRRDPATRSP